MFEIEQLLKGTPIPVDVNAAKETLVQHAAGSMAAEVAGAPPPMLPPPPQPQPSVPVNDWDFHQFEAAACQDWLSSEDCRTEQGKGNQPGVQNVVLHWRAACRGSGCHGTAARWDPRCCPPRRLERRGLTCPAFRCPQALLLRCSSWT